ncbi:MAG: aldose 1-epimerase [Gemmataceae bacterium]
MSFTIQTEKKAVAQLDGTIYVLEDAASGARAEIWPALGFNCFRWQAPWQGQAVDLLYADPELFHNPVPTRSGIPILFPFPNRIRAGQFTWQGKDFTLPINDPAKANAIHGFACRHPWRIVAQGTTDSEAWLQGEFSSERDAGEARALWPAAYRLRVTVRLSLERLRLVMEVTNTSQAILPFGIGLHPYFSVPLVPGGTEAECWVQIPAHTYWELEANLPTGNRQPVDEAHDLTRPRKISDLQLDDALSGLPGCGPGAIETLCLLGKLGQETPAAELTVRASPAFREVVVFNPPHRQAFCLEPYTCITDAINLQRQGIDAGLLSLPPGQQWTGHVELTWHGG